MAFQLTAEAQFSYKTGVDEIKGLKAAMYSVLKPIATHLNELDHWSGDDWFKLADVEYMSRDGFSAHSHNCGGVEIRSIVPKCGEYDFGFLEFGEYEDREADQSEEDYDRQRDLEEGEGHLDAAIRVWLKFEGVDRETNALQFYLVMDGGNNDAPYFRTKHMPTLFEASFECKSVAGIKRAAAKHIKALLKEMK